MKDPIQEGIIDDIDDALKLLDEKHLWKVYTLITATIGNYNGKIVNGKSNFFEELTCNAEHLADCAEDR